MDNSLFYNHPPTRLTFILFFFVGLLTQSFAQPGSIDQTFGTDGILVNDLGNFGDQVNDIIIQNDEKIVLGGYAQSSFTASDFALIRYNVDGSLDNTFGTDGIVITPIDNRSQGTALAIQNDEKIILGGFSKWFINVARYNSDGTLDTAFGTDGKVITDLDGYYSERCQSVVIQSDGKIVIGGYGQHFSNDTSYFILVRYNEDGTLDTTFGIDGKVIGTNGEGNSIAIQSDGKILIGGTYNWSFVIERYNPDGSLDNTFGLDGKVNTIFGTTSEANSLVLQNDEKILMGGYSRNGFDNANFAVARYNTDGSLDSTFGTGGKANIAFENVSVVHSLVIQPNGKILMGGFTDTGINLPSTPNFALARLNTNGVVDNTFGSDGKVISPIGVSYSVGHSLDIHSNGKIVLGGYAYIDSTADFALVRYHGDSSVGTEETCCQQNNTRIFPNPFYSATTIQFNSSFDDAEIHIYNALGQVVRQLNNISGKEIQFSRNDLPSGIYYLQLSENNKIISVDKLVINDK